MKYIALLLSALMILSSFTGCSRSNQDETEPENQEVTEEKDEPEAEEPAPEKTEEPKPAEDKKTEEEKPEAEKSEEETKPEAEKSETEAAEEKKPEEEKPAEEEKTAEETTETEKPAEEKPAAEEKKPLPFPKELMTLPETETKNNPQNLDDRLYCLFVNVMDRKFFRTHGKMTVHRMDSDGTQIAYELKFNLDNAIDSKGQVDPEKPIEAQMKIAKSLSGGGNYGEGETNNSESYQEYMNALEYLMTPLMGDGFVLQNLSSLEMTEEDGNYLIEATFSPAALKKIYGKEIKGNVVSYIQVDAKGALQYLGWEQTQDGKTVSFAKYSFA